MRIKRVKIQPKEVGVYRLTYKGNVVYIGQSINIKTRINAHAKSFDFDSFSFIKCEESELDAIEAALIAVYKPIHNKRSGENYKVMLQGANAVTDAVNGVNGFLMHPKKCEHCGNSYYPRTTWNRFCSTNCRVANWNEKKVRERMRP